MQQLQMPQYFSLHDICFQVTAPQKSKQWGEIGKRVAVLDSGWFLLVFADKTCQAFGSMSVEAVVMPSAPPVLHAGSGQVHVLEEGVARLNVAPCHLYCVL